MVFLLGVTMLVAGVWLCLADEVNLPGGRLLKSQPAQVAGVILLGFFPLYFLSYRFFKDWDDTAKLIMNWGLALFCLGSALLVILRFSQPSRSRQNIPSRHFSESAFIEAPEDTQDDQETNPPVPASPSSENPFDFS